MLVVRTYLNAKQPIQKLETTARLEMCHVKEFWAKLSSIKKSQTLQIQLESNIARLILR